MTNGVYVSFGKMDTFISTWAISESNMEYHEFCLNSGFFDLDNVLLAYHLCWDNIPIMKESMNIDSIIKDKGYVKDKIDIITCINYYAIK